MTSTPKVDFVFFDAGGGHRAAANALRQVVEKQERPWRMRGVNLQELLDSLDIFQKLTGVRLQDIYNGMLRRGWTLGSRQLLPLMHGVVRLYHGDQVRMLIDFWRKDPPDLAVSLVPNFNRALKQALDQANPDAAFVTILTDFADFPPHFWIERQPQYLICGTDRAVEQALSIGHKRECIFRASGMILRPGFYEPIAADRASERVRLGLRPDLPTGLVLFGGQGSEVMIEIARNIQRCEQPVQLIFICGRNAELAARLRAMQTRIPAFVEGFTSEVPYYMHLSDFFIGKPGPGSISEALSMRLPVIVERNAWTLPQERYNTDWVLEKQVGYVVPNFRRIHELVAALLEPSQLERYRTNVAAVENRAVFEIPCILEKILREGKCA